MTPTDFPTYEVTVRVETRPYGEPNPHLGWYQSRRRGWYVTGWPAGLTKAEAKADHAVTCADVGLPNVWPVSEGVAEIRTQAESSLDYHRTWWGTSVVVVSGSTTTVTRIYIWPTEAEAVEGHAAVARRWGVEL